LNFQKHSRNYSIYLPRYNPVGPNFEHLMEDRSNSHWYIWINGALVGKQETPAELGLVSGDTIKVVLP
jgi:hypothetical protein